VQSERVTGTEVGVDEAKQICEQDIMEIRSICSQHFVGLSLGNR
jgi:hypothetical protein